MNIHGRGPGAYYKLHFTDDQLKAYYDKGDTINLLNSYRRSLLLPEYQEMNWQLIFKDCIRKIEEYTYERAGSNQTDTECDP